MSADGERASAIDALRSALLENPGDPDAHGRIGTLLMDEARAVALHALSQRRRADEAARALFGEALEHFRTAMRLRPQSAQAIRMCGYALRELGELKAARESFAAAIRLGSRDARMAADYAATLCVLGDVQRAVEVLEDALSRAPEDPALHGELALALLGSGKFDRGWDEYEWRLRLPDAANSRAVPYRRWLGEPLQGRTLLVTSEQGIGDEIMFASCFGDLLGAAQRCLFEVSKRLASLFERSFPEAEIVLRSLDRSPQPERQSRIDYYTPAGSVPRFLRRSPQAFPHHAGYLRPDPALQGQWSERLAARGGRRKIGLAWTGGLPGTLRAARSVPLEALRPLLGTTDTFVALEFPDCAEEVAAFNAAGKEHIAWWPEAVSNLEQTAAVVSNLDLVISVPTATAHFAGALGRPVWVLVPAIATWRYMWTGERVPWYPSMRVIRGLGESRDRYVRRIRAALDIGC